MSECEFYAVVGVLLVGALLMVGGVVFGRRGAMGRGTTSTDSDARSTVNLYGEEPWGAPKVRWYARLWRWVKGLFGR